MENNNSKNIPIDIYQYIYLLEHSTYWHVHDNDLMASNIENSSTKDVIFIIYKCATT